MIPGPIISIQYPHHFYIACGWQKLSNRLIVTFWLFSYSMIYAWVYSDASDLWTIHISSIMLWYPFYALGCHQYYYVHSTKSAQLNTPNIHFNPSLFKCYLLKTNQCKINCTPLHTFIQSKMIHIALFFMRPLLILTNPHRGSFMEWNCVTGLKWSQCHIHARFTAMAGWEEDAFSIDLVLLTVI